MKRKIAPCALLAGALALSACGSGSEAASGSAPAAEENVTSITVGALPVADYAPLYYAVEEGLFADEGLDVTVQPIQGGASAVPAILSGDFHIAVTNWTSYIQALSTGSIPIRAVLPAAQGAPGFSGIVAAPGSGISEPADLAGRTIAVNNLRSIAELSTRASLEENGVDPDDVEFTELPLPDMAGNLSGGNVDAAWVVEPFLSAARAAGAEVVIDPFAGELDGLPLGGWSTSEEFAQANPETLDAFAAAMGQATTALADEATFREFLPSFTGLPPEVAATLTLPTTQTTLESGSLDQMAALMQEYGWIESEVDVDSTLDHLRNVQ